MTDTNQSIAFRSATPVAEPTQSKPTSTEPAPPQARAGSLADDDGPTPYVYEALEKKPYAVKFLGLELYNDDADFQEVQQQARELDKYVIAQAKAQGLKDSHDSYKEVINAIYKQIGRSVNEDPVKALKRLTTAAGALQRLNSAKLQPILSAKSLTPEEFEEVQP